MEKVNDDVSIGVERNKKHNVKMGGRTEMIQSAMETADMELKESTSENEEQQARNYSITCLRHVIF